MPKVNIDAHGIDRQAMIHAVFKAMDADDSNTVDHEEFMSMFSDKQSKHAKARLEEIDNMSKQDGREGAGDGQLTAKEFCDFMVDYTSKMPEQAFKEQIAAWHELIASSARKLLLRKVFSRMDVDNSGSVSMEEFRALFSDAEGGAASSVDVFRWIEGAEGNSDGELTVDEWVPFVLEQEKGRSDDEFHAMVDNMMEVLARKRRETLLRQVFFKMDADQTGSVDPDEFENLKDGSAEDAARLDMIHRYLDGELGDSDGELSIDEWVRGMKMMGEEMDDDAFEAEIAKWMAALAKNQRTVWRKIFSNGHAKQFVIAARAAGATHALFVQPAHTEPTEALPATRSAPTAYGLPPGDVSADAPTAARSLANAPAPATASAEQLGSAAAPRPASSGPLKPLGEKQLNRAASAKPSLGVSKSTPQLLVAAGPSAEEAAEEAAGGELRLTHRGTAQCMLARLEWFGRLPVRKMILCSPELCAKETALHLAGRLEEAEQLAGGAATAAEGGATAGGAAAEVEPVEDAKAPSPPLPLRICDRLAPTDESGACATLVAQKTRQQFEDGGIYSSAPSLRMLLDVEKGETAFGLYAESACEELAAALRGPYDAAAPGSKREKATYVSVFGHAGFNHAVAYAIASAAGMRPADLEKMLNLELGDVEGVLVPLFGDGKAAIHLKRPK